jgi:hypothetical protein
MQLHLPIFPKESKLISSTVAVKEKDGMVHYVANGLPFYCHGIQEFDAFRHVICLLVDQDLCRRTDIVKSFCVTDDFVGKALRIYREKGHSGLYNQGEKKRRANKIVGKVLEDIQRKLDKGQSVNSIANEVGVSEGAIRYQLNQNNLKKNSRRDS